MFEELLSYIENARGKRKVAIYGMGKVGTAFSEILNSIGGAVYIDNNINGFLPGEYLKNNKCFVLVTPLKGYESIREELIGYGYSENDDFICLARISEYKKQLEYLLGGKKYGLFGSFASRDDAFEYIRLQDISLESGYENLAIIDRVDSSIQKVREGRAAYERDGVLFDKTFWNPHLMTALFYISQNNHGKRIEVLDFGGSLGSVYFQHRCLLANFSWKVVEQSIFVERGREKVPELEFYDDIDDVTIDGENIRVILFSGVFHYLSNPMLILQKALNRKFDYIIFDRTYFNSGKGEIICVQKVPEEIYKANYPVILSDKGNTINTIINSKYQIVTSWLTTLENDKLAQIYYTNEDSYKIIQEEGMLFEKAK